MGFARIITFILIILFASCDCQYHLSGIVLNKQTGKPIEHVAIGKTDTEELDNPFNQKRFKNEYGRYDFYGIAGWCREITMFYSKKGYQTLRATLKNNSNDTMYLQPIYRQLSAAFDNEKDFVVVTVLKSNDVLSSSTDTSACRDWTLNRLEIEQIIRESKTISGPEWHHLFAHLPCRIHGKLTQNSTDYKYSINSGAWLTISSKDASLIFGSFDEENNRYFLSTAWKEDEKSGQE